MELTLHERLLIKQSYLVLEKSGQGFAEHFYECLFQMAPLIKPMFKSDRKLLEQHFDSLMGTAVSKVNQFHELREVLFNLGRLHRGYGVEKAQFEVVKSAFLLSIEYQLKISSASEILQAWNKYFDQIAAVMIEGLQAEE